MSLRLLLGLLSGMLVACSDNHGTARFEIDAPEPAAPVIGEALPLNEYGIPLFHAFVDEHELDEIEALQSYQLVILHTDDLDGEDTGGVGYDDAWIKIDAAGSREFCVDDNGDPDHYLELFDEQEQLIATVENGGCEELELIAGLYLYRVFHGGHSGIVFVQGEASTPPVPPATSGALPTRRVSSAEPVGALADGDPASAEDVLLRRLVNNQAPTVSTFRVSTRACVRCNLAGITLDQLTLDNVDLEGAHMSAASLTNVSLKGARLTGVDLSSATLDGVDLTGADLSGANLTAAKITATDMSDVIVGDYHDDPWEFVSAPSVSGTSTGQPGRQCWGNWRPDNFFDPDGGGEWDGAWSCPGNNSYLFLTALAADGWMYERSWDAKNGRGWSGWSGLPKLTKLPLSAPAATSDSTVGWHIVTYLATDGALWHNWRSISRGWTSWAPLGRPDGVILLSGPAASHGMLKADYRETEPPRDENSNAYGPYHEVFNQESGPQAEFYIAVMGRDRDNQQHVWIRSWVKCGGTWDHSPKGNSCNSYFEPNVTCVAAVDINDSRWEGSAEWCDLGGPDVGAASAPALAYLDEHDLVLTVVGTDGLLYQRGLGRSARHSRSWLPVNMPPTASGANILAAPGAGNAGGIGDALLTVLDENLTLWMGQSRSGGAYSWEQIVSTEQAEIVYAPDVESYGYTDRAYVVNVGRGPGAISIVPKGMVSQAHGAEQAGDLLAGNYFYQRGSNRFSLSDNLHHPGSGPQTSIGTSFAQTAFENVTLDLPLGDLVVTGASFDNVKFTQSHLQGADLSDAKITNSDLSGLDLRSTVLQGADLTDSDLSGTQLAGIVFGSVIGASGCPNPDPEIGYAADAKSACLLNANLSGTSLQGTDFSAIDLRSTDFDALPEIEYLFVPFGGAIDASDCNDSDIYAGVSGNDPGARTPGTINRTSLAGAQFTPAQFAPHTWRSLDLTNAKVSELQGASLAMLDYSDASMSGLTFTLAGEESLDFSQSVFKNANLAGLELKYANLSGGCFWAATLDGANFKYSNFTGAALRAVSAKRSQQHGIAIFDEAILYQANLQGSSFDEASFGKSDLRQVDASGASGPVTFHGAKFSHANLFEADFSQAVFSVGTANLNAKLPYVFMKNTVLKNAEFIGAEMTNAYIYGSGLDVSGVDFSRANLSQAYLVGVDFTSGGAPKFQGANLDNAVLMNAILTAADLSATQLAGDPTSASLVHARLEGADLGAANMNAADLTDAILCGPGMDEDETSACLSQSVTVERIDWNETTNSFQTVSEDITPTAVSKVDGVNTGDAVCPDGTSGGQDGCSGEQWLFNELPPEREPVDPNAW